MNPNDTTGQRPAASRCSDVVRQEQRIAAWMECTTSIKIGLWQYHETDPIRIHSADFETGMAEVRTPRGLEVVELEHLWKHSKPHRF